MLLVIELCVCLSTCSWCNYARLGQSDVQAQEENNTDNVHQLRFIL